MFRVENRLSINSFLTNIVAFSFALRAISYVWLAFTGSEYGMPWYSLLINLNLYFSAIIGFFYLFTQRKLYYKNFVFLIPLMIFFLYHVFHTYGGYTGSYIHELLAIGSFILFNREAKIKTFKYLCIILLICNFISIILFFLNIVGFNGFEEVLFYSDGLRMGTYQKWFVFALLKDSSILTRICGIFNEPGGLGTVTALVFAATYKRIKRFWSFVLLLSIAFSFSMAGYLLVFVFLAFHFGKRNRLNFIRIGLLIIAFLILPNINWGNEQINYFMQRFAFQDGHLVGDNRITTIFLEELNQMLKTNEAFFGKGVTFTAASGNSSWLNIIMELGIVGFILFVGTWVLAYVKNSSKNKECLLLLIVFLISLYQRPWTISNSYGYVLMIGAEAFLTDPNSYISIFEKKKNARIVTDYCLYPNNSRFVEY